MGNTSSPEGTVGLAEEADCGCGAKKDAAFQACPAPSWSKPFENAVCKKDATKEAVGCLTACAKDHADSAKKAAADAVQNVKDGVGSAIQNGKDTVESVSKEATRRKECFEKLVPCIKKCGIDVPADANELANVDTHEIADSSKKCVKKCEDDAEDCDAQN